MVIDPPLTTFSWCTLSTATRPLTQRSTKTRVAAAAVATDAEADAQVAEGDAGNNCQHEARQALSLTARARIAPGKTERPSAPGQLCPSSAQACGGLIRSSRTLTRTPEAPSPHRDNQIPAPLLYYPNRRTNTRARRLRAQEAVLAASMRRQHAPATQQKGHSQLLAAVDLAKRLLQSLAIHEDLRAELAQPQLASKLHLAGGRARAP